MKVYRAASPADRGRFDEEVRCLASLNHPGLVRVYDAGPCGEDAFVVLELIDGPPLSASIGADQKLPPQRVAALGAELADALDYIHQQGVVHRDVTPANVLCDPDGRPRLVDFGIVRLLDSPRVTGASLAVGTAAYMAPEQVQGHDVTPAADVYSLGLLLLEALTGRHEFVGSVQEVAMARLVRDPDTATEVPPEWRSLLKGLCQRDPAQRPTSAAVRGRLLFLAGAPEQSSKPVAVLETVGHSAEAATPTEQVDSIGGTAVLPAMSWPADHPARHRAPVPIWALGLGLAAALVAVLVQVANAAPGAPRSPATATSIVSPVATTTTTPRESRSAPRRATTTGSPTTVPTVSPDTVAPVTTTSNVVSSPPPTTTAPPTTSSAPPTTVAPG